MWRCLIKNLYSTEEKVEIFIGETSVKKSTERKVIRAKLGSEDAYEMLKRINAWLTHLKQDHITIEQLESGLKTIGIERFEDRFYPIKLIKRGHNHYDSEEIMQTMQRN